MALITCIECGNEFSDKAEACPKCGCPTSESTKATDSTQEAGTKAPRKAVYGQPLEPSSTQQNPSSGDPAKGTSTNGCATGCGLLVVGLILLGAIGSMFGDSDSTSPKSPEKLSPFTATFAKIYCKSLIKKQLRDPDSYKYEDAVLISSNGPYGTAKIFFRSKNGFGGYNRGSAKCTAYDNNGERYIRAVVE